MSVSVSSDMTCENGKTPHLHTVVLPCRYKALSPETIQKKEFIYNIIIFALNESFWAGKVHTLMNDNGSPDDTRERRHDLVHGRVDWPMLRSTDVTSWRRLPNVITKHVGL